MKSILLLLIIILQTQTSALFAETFNFDQNSEEWGSWGTGLGGQDPNIGHNKKGSLWLSTDWGEVQTLHYNWNKLAPGNYKITAYVRAQDVQAHPDGSTFWHFYDGGKGTENVFLDLRGNYEWRKIEYTLKVLKNELSIWFRLKSPGQVWIDDISVTPIKVPTVGISISPSFPLKKQVTPVIKESEDFSVITLLDFDKFNSSHPFSSISNPEGKKMGKILTQKYYNFEPSSYLGGNWSKYDRIELDIFNGQKDFVEFYLTLGDENSNNYWSQLNHKTHLAPGWNHLNFSLTQFLGERGSHRFPRPINRSKIGKFFIVVDPNEKFPVSSNFFIDNVKLTRNPSPVPPKNVLAFDFTSHKDNEISGFTKVTSQHLFDKEKGVGFVGPRFWRVEDSQWAANSLRYSIGLLGGQFKVQLPNGKYRMQLVIDRLGYWDPSFWKDRTVYINGKPIFKESRSYAKDYLNDFLQFEKVIPEIDSHPFDLYLKKIFKPIEASFTVTNGVMSLEFEGDATGISLNTLIVWDVNNDVNALKFLKENEKRSSLEFDWMARPIISKSVNFNKNESLATLIDPSLILKPTDKLPQSGSAINLQGGYGERPYQMIQIRSLKNVDFVMSDLKTITGAIIPKENVELLQLVPQYISPDLNHETYMLAGKYLKNISKRKIDVETGNSTFIYLAVNVKTDFKPGQYDGVLTFTNGSNSSEILVHLQILPYDLPAVDFSVGFFGPDPIPSTYFNDPELEKIRKEFRHEAIRLIGNAGFTTFSGLPEVKLNTDGDAWSLDTKDADEAMTAANRSGMSKVYFSYGGKFPQQYLDGSLIPDGVSEEVFYNKVSPLLTKYLERPGMPLVVHTFSDEAGGYSDKVVEDVAFAKKIKTVFPFLHLGGFGSKTDKATDELRSFFEYGFYSNISKQQVDRMGAKFKWGSYNASPGNLDDPRYTFGPGLYFSRIKGLSHYLEWHSSSTNNLPYYDLDGRESDVTMFMPTSDRKLHPTLRFIFSTEGIESYRKLIVLQEAILGGKGNSDERSSAAMWLESVKRGSWSTSENILKPSPSFNFKEFKGQLDKHLSNLFTL